MQKYCNTALQTFGSAGQVTHKIPRHHLIQPRGQQAAKQYDNIGK